MTPLTTEEPKSLDRVVALIPPLQDGERMTRIEFERRWAAMPELENVQLIEGVVHMPSPVRFVNHGMQHFDLIMWLGFYRAKTPGVRGGDNTTLKLDLMNQPQPDAFLIRRPDFGGNARVDADGYTVGAPELVGEVSASSVRLDLNEKFKAYQRNGVSEYIVWRTDDGAIDWFVQKENRFERLLLDKGIYKSEAFPGLWLDPAALIAEDMDRLTTVVERGVATPEHAAYVAELRKAALSLSQSQNP